MPSAATFRRSLQCLWLARGIAPTVTPSHLFRAVLSARARSSIQSSPGSTERENMTLKERISESIQRGGLRPPRDYALGIARAFPGIAGICRFCGCTQFNACQVARPDMKGCRPCAWADATKTVCDAPRCLAKAAPGQQRANPSNRKENAPCRSRNGSSR